MDTGNGDVEGIIGADIPVVSPGQCSQGLVGDTVHRPMGKILHGRAQSAAAEAGSAGETLSPVRLADGSTVPVDIGWTVVRLEDQIFATQVIFAEENEPSLLGVVTLEDALLAVDPVGQRLAPVEAERL